MRPPVLPSGNKSSFGDNEEAIAASMRPPVLPSGNGQKLGARRSREQLRFNEAAGFTQRKPSVNSSASACINVLQ